MITGLTLQVPNSDFSSLGLPNTIFPAYANLTEAVFYGTSIGDVESFRKRSDELILYRGTKEDKAYSTRLTTNGAAKNSVVLPSGNLTLSMLMTLPPLADPNVPSVNYNAALGSSAGLDGIINGIGINILYIYSTALSAGTYKAKVNLNTNAEVPLSTKATTDNTFLVVVVVDSTNLLTKVHFKTITSSDITQKTMTRAYSLNESLTLGTSHPIGTDFHSVAVHNKALSDAEVNELYSYYHKLYEGTGVNI